MASINERQRWDRWYTQVEERMKRQKDIITRFIAINTEAIAALEAIAHAGEPGNEDCRTAVASPDRAQLALDRIKGSAAASVVEEAGSYEEDTPVEDPRRNR